MKIAIVCLLACCLIALGLIFWALCKLDEDRFSRIVNKLDDLLGYKHDDIYFKLSQIRDGIDKLVEQKKLDKGTVKPNPPDALIIEPCPICGYIPAMYKHTELGSYCVRCSKGFGSKYDGSCSCSICVISDDKITAITTWNDAVNDYIMHKNEED